MFYYEQCWNRLLDHPRAATAACSIWVRQTPAREQKRSGLNNELIEVYKFRSMYVDACDATASRLVTKGDPRVTPVGRFIRRTSLDELPPTHQRRAQGRPVAGRPAPARDAPLNALA
jgi:hypothetical protein